MGDSEANRDEALRCVAIARRALEEGDVAKAEKFVAKGQRLYSCREVLYMAARIDEFKAARDEAQNRTQQQQQQHASNGSSHAHANGHGTSADHGRAGHARAAGGAGGTSSSAAGSGGQPSGMGGSHRQQADAGPRKRHSHADKPVIDENAGTPEQRKMVADILKAKDFYEILSLQRNCTDDDIKKAYRKMALKLHPDKNKAAHAEEAFKAVSKAFSCLSDSDKRAYYDRTGYESTQAASAAAAQQQHAQRRQHGGGPGVYYADDFDADEIFNMFFGGGLHGQMFRAQFGGMPRRRPQTHQHQQQQQAGRRAEPERPHQAMLGALVQFLPVILLLLFSLFSMFNTSSYSLARDSQFREQLHTNRLEVPFYVKSRYEFDRQYPDRTPARTKMEHEIERDYYDRISQRCHQERLTKQRLMYSWSTREEARRMRLPSCEEIERMNEKLAPPVRAY